MRNFWFLMLLVFFLASCSVFFHSKNKSLELTKKQIIDHYQKKTSLVHSFSAKYSLTGYNIPLYLVFKSNDSMSYLSVDATLFPFLKVFKDLDSFYVYLPMLKSYFSIPNDSLKNFNTSNLFAFFVATVFSPFEDVPLDSFSLTFNKDYYNFYYRVPDPSFPKFSNYYVSFLLSKDLQLRRSTFIDFVSYREFSIIYDDYQKMKVDGFDFEYPKFITFYYITRDTIVLQAKLKSLTINKNVRIKKKIPKNAKRVRIDINAIIGQ